MAGGGTVEALEALERHWRAHFGDMQKTRHRI